MFSSPPPPPLRKDVSSGCHETRDEPCGAGRPGITTPVSDLAWLWDIIRVQTRTKPLQASHLTSLCRTPATCQVWDVFCGWDVDSGVGTRRRSYVPLQVTCFLSTCLHIWKHIWKRTSNCPFLWDCLSFKWVNYLQSGWGEDIEKLCRLCCGALFSHYLGGW